ncbi:Actin-related protein 4 [Polyrhizophydium stewartii]|uniref:Actin-related protein 4 n=1 Tax=Polyrhizophydium stewartii TaxID=2732419 RepID=A0ABR4ND08_9FUNG
MVVFGGDEVSALVLDVGSRLTKAGYAGEDMPKGVFSSLVGTIPASGADMDVDVDAGAGPRAIRQGGDAAAGGAAAAASAPAAKPRRFVGDTEIFRWREGLELRSPLEDGVVSDWDALEALWDHVYARALRAEPTEHPLLFCEPSWNPREKREKLCELAFEKYQVPAFYLGRSAVLSAFAAGKPSALVVDSGAAFTSVVPVYDGYVLKKAIRRAPLGGDFVSDQIRMTLENLGVELVPQFMVASKMPVDPQAPPSFVRAERPNTTKSFTEFGMEQLLQEFKETIVQIAESRFDEKSYRKRPQRSFEFPNGFNRPFGLDRFKCVEGLFNPQYALTRPGAEPIQTTITRLIAECTGECDFDLRSTMINNIVLTGGNSLLPGFADRLYTELHLALPGARVKVHAAGGPLERRFGPWIGGSILASLGSFHQLWISKQQYEEMGPSVEKRIH